MTALAVFNNLATIVADLSQSMTPERRYQRLLDAFRCSFSCDAIALLQLEGDVLVPRAVQGLSPDALGRRFVIADQPRLSHILYSREPVRFPADSPLPDPYDGLIETPHDHLYVHDCLGAALHIDERPWGVLTLDALSADTFDTVDEEAFNAFVAVAAASVRAAAWIHHLEEQLERHYRVNRSQLHEDHPDDFVAGSEVMAQLRREAITVAPSDLPVLVLGETGVGKELVARSIHRHSTRAQEPIVHVNCAALPEALAESELFGHVRGAFSGATDDRIGKFELADKGTLFLDEVGELPLAVQAKLLRALQGGEIQRLGSDHPHHVDVRLVAATNRDLKQEVIAGRFRSDLYHRLSVYPLQVPPLRERGKDILLLAGYFLARRQRQLGLRGVRLAHSARRWLMEYSWPGNVRELDHTLSRAIIKVLSNGHRKEDLLALTARHLGGDIVDNTAAVPVEPNMSSEPSVSLQEAMDEYRRALVQQRLHQYSNNYAATARSLGLDRGNFHRLLKRLGLK